MSATTPSVMFRGPPDLHSTGAAAARGGSQVAAAGGAPHPPGAGGSSWELAGGRLQDVLSWRSTGDRVAGVTHPGYGPQSQEELCPLSSVCVCVFGKGRLSPRCFACARAACAAPQPRAPASEATTSSSPFRRGRPQRPTVATLRPQHRPRREPAAHRRLRANRAAARTLVRTAAARPASADCAKIYTAYCGKTGAWT